MTIRRRTSGAAAGRLRRGLTVAGLALACLALATWGGRSAAGPITATPAGPGVPGSSAAPAWMPAPVPGAGLAGPPPGTVQTVPPAAAEAVAKAAEESVATAAAVFRLQAAADVRAALRLVPSGTSFDFLAACDSFKAVPDVWTYFFSTTVLFVGNQGTAEPTAAFYSPFFDAAVLVRWNFDAAGRPYVAGASLRSGAEVEGGAPSAEESLPRWMMADGPPPASLAGQYRGFAAAFSRQFPPGAPTPWAAWAQPSAATLNVTGRLAMLQAAILVDLQGLPESPLREPLAALRAAALKGDAAGLAQVLPAGNPLSAQAVAELPLPFRCRLCPVFVVWDDRQALIFLGDGSALRFGAIALYDARPPARLVSLAIYDLEAGAGAAPPALAQREGKP